MVEVLAKITANRSMQIKKRGFEFGYTLPDKRLYPLITPQILNFQNLDSENSVFCIAEIKRASPSAGQISAIPSPIDLAQSYLDGGAGAISVLCEEDYFHGSLQDLMEVKATYPKACILRKDFIQHKEEIEISYRAGADMVLLIVAMFIQELSESTPHSFPRGFKAFKEIYDECLRFGITPILEVHNEAEVAFLKPILELDSEISESSTDFKPRHIIGINSRSLHTFEIDIPAACSLKNKIPPHNAIIFESGIHSPHQGYMIGSLGFSGVLCGSYLVASSSPSSTLATLKNALIQGRKKWLQSPKTKQAAKQGANGFYERLFSLLAYHHPNAPLLKVCGITSLDDALLVAQEGVEFASRGGLGVSMLGFIMVAKSPRFIESRQIKAIAKSLDVLYPHILRIGVVNDKASLKSAIDLYQQGILDAIQIHGLDRDNPSVFDGYDLSHALFSFYGVFNISCEADFNPHYEGAICLVDSQSTLGGGSGKSIDFSVLHAIGERYLCIAGGINPSNFGSFLTLSPAMLDINSGIESAPGKKDREKLRAILSDTIGFGVKE